MEIENNIVKNESDIDPIYIMDEILDKLKLLDYDTLFLKQK